LPTSVQWQVVGAVVKNSLAVVKQQEVKSSYVNWSEDILLRLSLRGHRKSVIKIKCTIRCEMKQK
jgi:hypothetical protein